MIEIPVHPVFQLLTNTAAKYPEQTAVRYNDEAYTYRQLKENVDSLAAALANLGLQKGDRAAVMFPNCPQYMIAYYAVLQAGGIVVQVNPHYTEHELKHILQDSGAKWVLTSDEQTGKLLAVRSQTAIERIILFGPCPDSPDHTLLHAEKLIASCPPCPPQPEIDAKEDVAVLQYTGGTTGRSKGVMLTHYNLVANAYQSYWASSQVLQIPGEVTLGISPLYHVYGMTSCMNVSVLIGGTVILLSGFDRDEVIEIIAKYRPTLFPGVPTMYIALLNHPKSGETDLTCLKVCNCGSAPMPVEVIHQFEAKTGARIVEGYGLSEASPVTHRNPVQGIRKAGSIGIPLVHTEARIVDLETGGRTLSTGEAGELVVKGPQVMKGYWNNPEETRAALREGWLYTGDIAMMDEDGYYYIVGRKKELIITGGLNVYPKEVEEVLYQHPAVQEAAVVGIPDSYRGEAVKAYVVPKQGQSVTEEELIDFCRSQLSPYKAPRSVELRSSLPKTTVGKILKRTLVEEERMNMKDSSNAQ
ncbi:long-chain-fatty-acid--CoA ligase [Effusibacillus lacus]|uniref:Long-chain-fatty-acid--CoA ligase n=1 Tax=Effusibacillus lacus TaxID=1348429 RepID=A0A292YH86_9BACL|nr:long-chain fatty acid--CoA ligase [Effusibacillus lacus]TCS71652.1 long-chain acyl-CoA synthetase [Effusibacillus lacus]GAX90157.1 long-chain-fatty-acid--CoA ligase [Effusibacillus lacus]